MQAKLENIPCIYFISSEDGFIIDVNQPLCETIGYTREELVFQKVELIFTLSTRIFQQTHLFPLLRMKGHAEEIYITLRHKAKHEIPILINATMHTGDQTCFHFAGIPVSKRKKFEEEIIAAKKAAEKALHENTALKTAKEDLQKHAIELDRHNLLANLQNLELKQFNHLTTHSLQEPVRKLMIFSGMIADSDDEEKIRLYAQKMRKSAEELDEKVKGLQQFGTLSNDKLEFVKVDLDQVWKEVHQEVQAENPEISLTTHAAHLPEIDAIADQIHFMMKEVLTNAVNFRKPDQQVEVHIEGTTMLLNKFRRLAGNYSYTEFVKLHVRDNGMGFNDEYQKQAFDMFRKLHPAGGMGIGLSLCKKIVDNHAGTISIESQEGMGATIVILLPLSQANR